MKDTPETERRYPPDEQLHISQTAENADRIDAICERVDRNSIEIGIQKWISRITIAVLLALGGICWELIKTILKYAPAIIKALESTPKK